MGASVRVIQRSEGVEGLRHMHLGRGECCDGGGSSSSSGSGSSVARACMHGTRDGYVVCK